MKMQSGSGSGGYINHLPTASLITPHHHVATERRVCRQHSAAAARGHLHGGACMHRLFN